MKKSQTHSTGNADLRRQAEGRLREMLKNRGPEASELGTMEETKRLVHELEVHQIELEMQNEELLQARTEAEALTERYIDLYDFAPIGYFTLDRGGTIQQVNLTGARLLGQERSRLVRCRFGLFVSGADRPVFNAFLERAFKGKAKESCEISLHTEEGDPPLAQNPGSQRVGKTGQTNVRIEGTATEDGKALRVVVEDTTELKKVEMALRERVKELSCLFRLSHLIEQPGISLEEILEGCVQLIPAAMQHPDITCARLSWGSAVFKSANYRRTEWRISRDLVVAGQVVGTLDVCYLEDRSSNTGEGPFLQEEVELTTGIAEKLQRIISRKRAEEALAESEERFRTLAGSAPDGIFRFDREFRLLYMNPVGAHWIGVEPPFQLPEAEASYTRPDMLTTHWEASAREVFETGHLRRLETAVERHGRVWSYDVIVAPEIGRDGSVRSVISVARDITERRQQEASRRTLELKVQQAQKLESLEVLAGGVAHDFNNLLMGVLGNAELTLLELPPSSPHRKYQTSIKAAAVRMAEISKQMLDYSGKGRFLVTALNLSDLVAEMASLLKVSLPKKVALKLDLGQDLPVIQASGDQLRQIILNLVINGAEAVGEQVGLVTIHTGSIDTDQAYLSQLQWHDELRAGLYAYVEVSDTGCGMTRDLQDKIFDPFFTTKFTGRGLGLAAVQGIVRGHKGAISVRSEQGNGSTFRILFPSAEHSIPIAADQPVEAHLRSGAGQAVLVVDDEETVRTTATMLLNRVGFSVMTAVDGEEALKLLSEHPQDIDLVLLDLSMPRMDGIETFAKIRKVSPHLPIILSSGYNEQEATQAFTGKGLSGFIQKPYDLESLLKKVLEVCRSAPRMQPGSGSRAADRGGSTQLDPTIRKSPGPEVLLHDPVE